jgi:hypothetical protein
MAKSRKDVINGIHQERQRLQEAAKRAEQMIHDLINPIAEKAAAAVRSKIEDALKANIDLANDADLSKETLSAAADAFFAILSKQDKAETTKAAKAKGAEAPKSAAPAAPAAPGIEA